MQERKNRCRASARSHSTSDTVVREFYCNLRRNPREALQHTLRSCKKTSAAAIRGPRRGSVVARRAPEQRSLHAQRVNHNFLFPSAAISTDTSWVSGSCLAHHALCARGSFVGRRWSRVVERLRGTLILPRCEHWPPHGWIRIAIRCPWGDCHGHGPHSHSRTRF